MKLLSIPVGVSDFEEIRRNGYYYVDKSGLIGELLSTTGTKVTLITRPRRFGKTLGMSMLESFFDIRKDNKALFEELEIAKRHELCMEWMNQWPTVFVSFRQVDGLNFNSAYDMLTLVISELYKKHLYLLDSDKLDSFDKEIVKQLIQGTASAKDMKGSLMLLTRLMYQQYGKPVILLIDEYDVPVAKANRNGYYEEMLDVMKGLMQALQEKYGTDANDLVALTEAVRNGAVKDDAYYEKLAMEKGVSTRTARELDKLESQNKHLTEQQQMIQQMERQRAQQARIAELQAGWDREAEQLKAQYPDFNMAEVLANPEVEKMMRSGVSMTNAYRSAYFDHILKQQQAATARQVEQGVVNRMQQRNARPGENGTRPGGAVQTKIDVSHMSRKEMEEMEKRAMRGEVITL